MGSYPVSEGHVSWDSSKLQDKDKISTWDSGSFCLPDFK